MLQQYKFIEKAPVNILQKDIAFFIRKIESVTPADAFDPDTYFPPTLAKKVKAKVRNKKGEMVDSKLYVEAKGFFDKYRGLAAPMQGICQAAFTVMNNIGGLFDGNVVRQTLSDLPVGIRAESKSLFVYLYEETLTAYGIKNHYEAFCKQLGNNWCPFCGMEQLEDYTHIKEDYDHLLAKSIYPFAAVNMRNLAPMGKKCNRTHKKAKDLIWDDVKQIKAISPYNKKIDIRIDFTGTKLPDQGKKNGDWKIKLLPTRDEVMRWDFIFNITDRIVKDFLTNGAKPEFEVWLTDYLNEQIDNNNTFKTIKACRESFYKYGIRHDSNRYRSFRFIRADLFKWIATNAPDSYIQSKMDTINKKKLTK